MIDNSTVGSVWARPLPETGVTTVNDTAHPGIDDVSSKLPDASNPVSSLTPPDIQPNPSPVELDEWVESLIFEPPTRWERVKHALQNERDDFRDMLKHKTFRTIGAVGLACLGVTVGFGIKEEVQYRQEKQALEARRIDPMAAELGAQIRMLAEDPMLNLKPRLSTIVSDNGVAVHRSYSYMGGTVRVAVYDEAYRSTLDEKFKFVKNPDGTTIWVRDGFEDAPTDEERRINRYEISYSPGDNSSDYFTVSSNVNKETNKVLSLVIYNRSGEVRTYYSTGKGLGTSYYQENEATGQEIRLSGASSQATEQMVYAYNLFNNLTSHKE